nr:MAG TPA: hypothetical protein [Caudoviricetes sp.]
MLLALKTRCFLMGLMVCRLRKKVNDCIRNQSYNPFI